MTEWNIANLHVYIYIYMYVHTYICICIQVCDLIPVKIVVTAVHITDTT